MWTYREVARLKSRRESFIASVRFIGAAYGFLPVDEDEASLWGPRSLQITLARGPYRLTVCIDASEPLTSFLGHWYIIGQDSSEFPKEFGRTHVNTYHQRKATTCESDSADFLDEIEARMAQLSHTSA